MKKLFSPAIALMNRLGYTWKFMVLWLIYLAAITMVMYSLYENLSQVSLTSKRELEGIALIKPISTTVQFMQQHRGLSGGLLGGIEDLRSAHAAKLIETTAAFNALKNQLPAGLILSEHWMRIEADWSRLQAEGLNWTVDQSFTAHTRLIEQILGFELDVADEYALTLDSDIDSFYLIDTAISKLPRALERLGQIRAFGTGILAKKQLSEYQKTTLITLIAQLDDSLKLLDINLDKTGRLNPKIQPQLSETSKDIINSSHKIVQLVQSDIINNTFSTTPIDFIKITTDIIDRNYQQMFAVLLPTTETLINARIERADNKLRLSIGTAFLLLLVAFYFFIGSYYAMKDSIQSLARSARAFAGGDLCERINLGTRDEFGQVADSFNEMADGFQALLTTHIEVEDRLRTITDNAPTVLFMKDVSGRYIHVNRLYEELFHVDNATILGKTDHDIFPQEMADAFCKNDQEVILSGKSIEVEELALHDDGIHTYLSVKFPLRKVSGEIYAVCGIATDITERKQTEKLLQTSETYLRAIFDSTPDAMLISDEQGNIALSNQQAESLLGYPINELLGLSIEALVPKCFRAGHPALRAQFAASAVARPMGAGSVVKALRKDGGELDVEISLSPIQTAQGLFFASALRDITERKQAEAALRASEERFRRMADSSPIMIWITDAEGEPTFVNQAWLDFAGIDSVESMTHGGWTSAIHPDDRETAFAAYYQNTEVHQAIATEYRLRNANGDWRWILDTGMPLYDQNGAFTGYIGSAIDITERKQIELDQHIAAVAFESQEAIVITDTAGVILRINKAFTESTGYTAEEAVGQKISMLKSGRHDADFYAAMWESILSVGAWQGEIWDRRKNGEIYPKWLSITAVKGSDGLITHYVGTHIDITERKAAEQQIQQLAFYDPLTQLPNRRLLQERLKHGINVERRDGRQLGLLMLDLDRFKAVNDSLGHLAGDELLQQVAARITARLRDVDMVARLGGDEFIVLLEDIAQPEDAARVAEEIITDLTKPFCLTQRDNVQIGASIGISLYPQHGDSPERLMDHADAALYQAKDAGRGCFAYFSEELTIAARERMALETRLRRAIEQQELRVFFQPQVDIASGRIVGAEALVRWQDPVEGLISPIRFIAIAEETGLIVKIGGWVLRETCRQGRQWLDAGLPPLTLAVNVSSHQFRRSDICALVATVLSDTGFPPEQLELEITESGLMENQDNAVAILDNLRAQGVRLAIDDFGTGYSSLAYLKHFPLDVLKIDKSFIDDIPFHQDDMEIAATIVAMGHILGFKVLAEGVETPEQLAFLQGKDCDMYQGYIKSKPVPADVFVELLRAQ